MARGTVDNDVSDFSHDWRRLRTQKHRSRGGVEGRIITNLGFWYGEHYLTQARDSIMPRAQGRDEDRNKLFLVFNLFRKQIRRKIGRLWSVDPSFGVTPNSIDPTAMDKADVANNLLLSLDNILHERTQHWQRLWWLALGGVVIEHVPWIEDVGKEPMPAFDDSTHELLWKEQQTGATLPQSKVEELCRAGIPPERFKVLERIQTVGQVGSEIISPLQFFIDASVTSIDLLAPDQACYIAEIKTKGWIKSIFGSDVADNVKGISSDLSIVETRLLDKGSTASNMNLRDMLPAIQGSRTADDPEMAIVLTRYQPACEDYPHGRRTILVPDQVTLDDDEIPYGSMPLKDLHWEPPTTTFWTGDFGTDMIPGQKFLNKRMSQLGESANASIYEILLLGGELTAADIPTDMAGVVPDGLSEDGQPRVQVMQRGALPQFFLESIKLIVEFIENVGSSDLTQSRQFPGQLRGPLAIPMLQDILDSEDGPFYEHMGEQLAAIKQLRLQRVKEYYPPIRTLHYNTGKKDEVLVFHKDDILETGVDYTVTVDRSTLVPEISALRRARVREDLESPISIIYTNRRTGRIDPSKIAMALKYTDKAELDREVQWRKLAQNLIKKLWAGTPLDERMPYAFWDHNAVMDELEATFATTEWNEASPSIQDGFLSLYEKCRQFLDQIQQAQAQSAQAGMMQSAVAQATQQTAAKVAAETVEASLAQIKEQVSMATANPPAGSVQAQLAAQSGQQSRLANTGQRSQPPQNLVKAPSPTALNIQQLLGRK